MPTDDHLYQQVLMLLSKFESTSASMRNRIGFCPTFSDLKMDIVI
jgi:hypothetical protein